GPADSKSEGVQHHLQRLHRGDAASAARRRYRHRDRLSAHLHQLGAPDPGQRLDLLRPGQDRDPVHSRPQGHDDLRQRQGQPGPAQPRADRLLLAIEEPDEIARERIRPDKRSKYFPKVPFAGWQPQYTEKDLPLFGSIGWMYQCYADYTDITYSDGTTLWDYVFNPQSLQRDLYNVTADGHPEKEYPGFQATVSGAAAQAHALVKDMMRAITDQGEGSLIKQEVKKRSPGLLQQTLARYAPSKPAMEADYPSYDASGNKKKLSDDAGARYQPGPLPGSELDHYERFQ